MTLLERTKRELTKEIHWSRKAIVIQIYHEFKLANDRRATYADTARDLELSKAYISEAIKLSNAMGLNPELIHLSRNTALFRIRLGSKK